MLKNEYRFKLDLQFELVFEGYLWRALVLSGRIWSARIWMWVWDILVLGTLGPWDPWTLEPWTLGLLDLFPPPTPPHTSPCILLPPPISSSYSPPLVWFGYGGRGGMSWDIWEWDWRWTFYLYIDPLGPPQSFYVLFLYSPPTSFLFLPATPPSSQTSS